MSWLYKNKLALIIFGLLFAINLHIFLQTTYTNEFDSAIQRVKEKLINDEYLYEIHLRSTDITPASTLKLIFEDGSTQTRPVLADRKEQLTILSPRRLEYVSMTVPTAESNMSNNGHNRNIWSEEVGLMTVTTDPEFNFVVDQQNRLWVVCSGRVQEKEKPSVLLTVLAPDGTFLVENQRISPEGIYSVYPVIQQMADGNMHIVWSSYEHDTDILYYATYGEQDGKITLLSQVTHNEEEISLQHPIFVSNEPADPVVAVLVKYQFYTGFALYRLTPDGFVKIPTIINVESGIVHQDISFFRTYNIKDMVLIKDSKQRYSLIWDEIDMSGVGYLYLTTFDQNFKAVTSRSEVGRILAIHTHPRLEVIAQDQKLYLFYSEEFTRLDPQNQLCYNIIDEDGQIIARDMLLDGPSPLGLRDLSVALDEQGNFNLAWTDARVSKASRINRDLVVKSLTPQLEIMIPPTPLTDNLVDQMVPRLRFFNSFRYLVWADLRDGTYQLKAKSTYPGFLSSLKTQQQWNNLWEKTIHAISVTMLSIGAQIIFLFPLNLFPLVGILVVMYLFTTHRIRDHWLNWISTFLILFLLKYINLNLLSKTSILTLAGAYKLSLVTFCLTLALFFIIHLGWNRWQTSALHKSLYLFGWLALDAIVLTLIYYFQRI